mmetsp:Transcript_3930/g.8413  ORF Transcript_3930/g.8413 Transcript_3930/m.8413 type:complete len:239 (+) Transcript_3930:2929-3645(+)
MRFSMRASVRSALRSSSGSACPWATCCRSRFTVNDCFSVATDMLNSLASASANLALRACHKVGCVLAGCDEEAAAGTACLPRDPVPGLLPLLLLLPLVLATACFGCGLDAVLPLLEPSPFPEAGDCAAAALDSSAAFALLLKPNMRMMPLAAVTVVSISSWSVSRRLTILFSTRSSFFSLAASTLPTAASCLIFFTVEVCLSVADATVTICASRSNILLVRLRHMLAAWVKAPGWEGT